jgi:hypothetical protein
MVGGSWTSVRIIQATSGWCEQLNRKRRKEFTPLQRTSLRRGFLLRALRAALAGAAAISRYNQKNPQVLSSLTR